MRIKIFFTGGDAAVEGAAADSAWAEAVAENPVKVNGDVDPMLIAVTSEGRDWDSLVEEKFGRAPFLILYNQDENTFESFRNPYVNIFGGAGIQTAQFMIEKNVSAVITVEIGIQAFRFLKSAGVDVYYSSKEQVKEAVKKFVESKLSLITQISLQNSDQKIARRKRYRGGKV